MLFNFNRDQYCISTIDNKVTYYFNIVFLTLCSILFSINGLAANDKQDQITINKQKQKPSMFFDVYFETALGHDTNPNFLIDNTKFTDFTLISDTEQKASNFYSLKIGNHMKAKINDKTRFTLAASFQQLKPSQETPLDYLQSNLEASISQINKQYTDSLIIQLHKTDFGSSKQSHVMGFAYNFDNNFSRNAFFSYFIKLTRFDSISVVKPTNAMQVKAGSSVRWSSNTANNPTRVKLEIESGKDIPENTEISPSRYITHLGLSLSQQGNMGWPIEIDLTAAASYFKEIKSNLNSPSGPTLTETHFNVGFGFKAVPYKLWEFNLKTLFNKNVSNETSLEYQRNHSYFSIKRYL